MVSINVKFRDKQETVYSPNWGNSFFEIERNEIKANVQFYRALEKNVREITGRKLPECSEIIAILPVENEKCNYICTDFQCEELTFKRI